MKDFFHKLAAIGFDFWVPAGLAALWLFLLVWNVLTIGSGSVVLALLIIVVSVYFLAVDTAEAVEAWEDYEEYNEE
jgi:hypothetical protein